MAKTQKAKNLNALWWLIVALAIGLLVFFASKFDQGTVNDKYGKPFEAKYKEMEPQDEDAPQPSSFKPAGMSESKIKKYQGNHYETY